MSSGKKKVGGWGGGYKKRGVKAVKL